MMVKPPRLILRVEFVNISKETVDVTIRDLVCPLGNFAVRPERVSLAPGQRVELDPMLSNTDSRFDQFYVRLVARLAGAADNESYEVNLAGDRATTDK
jgi:hypothetical protein